MATAIEFDNIGKQYRLGLVSTQTLSHDLHRWWTMNVLRKEDPYLKIGETNDRSVKGNSDYVWALKDINFKVEQGDVVGIIGRNGAGKSTLLKLLSRVTAPTTGEIRSRGRIGSLLEVGTGFHPEMTGRENIYMNGAIMGMTRAEINRKLDDIVDFSGCSRYLDTPVKRYSSGMTVRLGFAVAAFLEPEILVVDEVLAVGDAEFQKKAIGKMKDVSQGEGRTVLFVSHNMAAVRNLCRSGVVLRNGSVVYTGPVNDAVDYYLEDKVEDCIDIKSKIVEIAPYIKIDHISFNGLTQSKITLGHNQKYLDIEVKGSTSLELNADLAFTIRNMDDVPLASLAEGHFKAQSETIKEGNFTIKKRIRLPRYMYSGDVCVDLAMHQPGVCMYFNAPKCIQLHIEGSMAEYGRALDLRYNGFYGFESI